MSLLDDARLWTRVTDEVFDPELRGLIAAALTDMRRTGVREVLLDPSAPAPLARQAVMLYVKAMFGYDNSEATRFMDAYRQTVSDLLNSAANMCADEDDDADVEGYAAMVEDALSRMGS